MGTHCPTCTCGRIRIARAVRTCYACPSQWDAWTDKGEYLYLRFRHGYGTADMEEERIAEFDASTDGLDGVIDLEDFCARAGFELALGAS